LSRTVLLQKRTRAAGKTTVTDGSVEFGQADQNQLREKIKKYILQMDAETLSKKHDPEVKERIKNDTMQMVNEESTRFPIILRSKIHQMGLELIEEALGYGPIEPLRRDPEITEIMVNGPGKENVFIEKKGKTMEAFHLYPDAYFPDDRSIKDVIERIIAPLGRRCDDSSPYVDARLPDGSRVNAVINPISLGGSAITIRRFGKAMGIEELIELGAYTEKEVELLKQCVEAKLNIFISGGTGSGKTTQLNVLSSFIPENERIITIEDAAELQLKQKNLVRLESRPANMEGKGAVTIRDLVRNALRMRPDRIVVGECRGGEALDMLQAMNTGHDGSLSTGHANTPQDMIIRLETMVLMAGYEMPIAAIRQQIVAAIDLIAQFGRMKDGSRKLVSIAEVVGYENGEVITKEMLRYDDQKKKIVATGHVPQRIIGKIQEKNMEPARWLKEVMMC
jgi:pilus assembly protein CpaF